MKDFLGSFFINIGGLKFGIVPVGKIGLVAPSLGKIGQFGSFWGNISRNFLGGLGWLAFSVIISGSGKNLLLGGGVGLD